MKYIRGYSGMFRQILSPLVWVCQQKAAVRGGLGSAATGLGELQKLMFETRTTTRRGVRLALAVGYCTCSRTNCNQLQYSMLPAHLNVDRKRT